MLRSTLILAAALAVVSATDAPTPVEKAATEAVSKLEKMGVDTVQKRAVIGGAAGLIGGMIVKKMQDTLVTCGVIGGVLVGGACYIGWVKPEQVEEVATKAKDQATGWYAKYFGDAGASIQTKISKSKLMAERLYKRAPGLVVGGAAGALVGYRLG